MTNATVSARMIRPINLERVPHRRRTDVQTRVLPRLAWRDDLPLLPDDPTVEQALEAHAVFPMELTNR